MGAMGKKKKKPKARFVKRVKKVVRQHAEEIVLGLATGIITNYITDASEKLMQGNITEAKE
jgi:hypothetical protein